MPAPVDLDPRLSVAELKSLAAHCQDRAYAQRLRAIALIAEGLSRVEVADRVGIGAATLRHWVIRYNASGPEGLRRAPPSGRPAKLSDAQRTELKHILKLALHQDQISLAEIAATIKSKFGVDYDPTSVGRLVRSLGFVHTGGRWHLGTHHIGKACTLLWKRSSGDCIP